MSKLNKKITRRYYIEIEGIKINSNHKLESVLRVMCEMGQKTFHSPVLSKH